MPAATVAQQVDAHAVVRAGIATKTTTSTLGLVRRFDDWYSTAGISSLATKLVRIVEAGQRQTAGVTDAYLARVLTQMRGTTVRPVGVVDVSHLRTGVEHDAVYGRIADTYRWRISEGDEPDEALEKAANRAAEAVSTDLDLAFREQMHEFMDKREVSEYRRVIRPELSAGGSCGLCVVASDQIYSREDLFPLHAHCKCGVVPVDDEDDPGLELNREDFARLYSAAGGTTGKRLKRVRIAVKEHGEIGAVLVRRGDNWRDASDVERDKRTA